MNNIFFFSKFFFSKVFKFTWKMLNVLNRKRNRILYMYDFHFSGYGHFYDVITPIFRWIFPDNSKNKNWRIFLLYFSFYSAHFASSIKTGSKLKGEGGLHILSREKARTCTDREKLIINKLRLRYKVCIKLKVKKYSIITMKNLIENLEITSVWFYFFFKYL